MVVLQKSPNPQGMEREQDCPKVANEQTPLVQLLFEHSVLFEQESPGP